MPTYEYACTSCRRRFEVVQRFTDAPLQTCEECGGTLKRVFHPVGVVLKGPGFYSTDNRSKKGPTPAKKEAATQGTASAESGGGAGASKKDATPSKDAGSSKTDTGSSSKKDAGSAAS